jgi:hypothetical protein
LQLIDIRNEILAHGFDPLSFTASRLNNYINDGLMLIARRADYYANEGQMPVVTVAGTSIYPLLPGVGAGYQGLTAGASETSAPFSSVARIKSCRDIGRNVELEAVQERDIDRSSTAQGTPNFYAIGNGGNLLLYPTPDAVYSLLLRCWFLPPKLVNDTDVPVLPQDWHHLLWEYGCWKCYEAEDDPTMGGYWKAAFMESLAEFAADQKFPSTDFPTQINSIWEQDKELANNGWALYWGW